MRRRLAPCCCALALLGLLAATAPPSVWAQGESPVTCAGTAEGIPSASPSEPCWEAIRPYPFGIEGEPCAAGAAETCYQTVTSMAFRSWNFGLAATTPSVQRPGTNDQPFPNPYGVWIFNGTRWYPDPTFPGSQTCPGRTIVWAGKLDYWLIGEPSGRPFSGNGWGALCRFNGVDLTWEPFVVPEATLRHVLKAGAKDVIPSEAKPGGLTSGACFAWNNCWFFGSYGVVVHWNGEELSDATPEASKRWLHGEYTGAVAREDPAGNPFGLAVSATSEYFQPEFESELLPAEPDGSPPPELFGSTGGAFSPLPLVPPTDPQMQDPDMDWVDPYRTDLVAVDFDSEGQGWVAGNPASLRAVKCEERTLGPCQPPFDRGFEGTERPQPSPLIPVSLSGERRCAGPADERFSYTPNAKQISELPEGAFLWSSIGTIPGTGEVLAGGLMRPRAAEGDGPNEDGTNQPVIVRASCEGATSVTRFRVEDATARDYFAPGDRKGTVTALAANAPNDAWAATSAGSLTIPPPPEHPNEIRTKFEEPHLYRLTNGLPPEAPAGNDEEYRPLPELEPPLIVLEPPTPPPPAPPPAVLATPEHVGLKPAVYGLKSKLHRHGKRFILYLSFKLRRPITIGAEGLRHGRVVSEARPRHFTGSGGTLMLVLNRKHWPTKVRFIE
jgi:hypothetical protein